jgi:hypothetical protein
MLHNLAVHECGMTKWIEIFGAILWSLSFPLLFAFIVCQIDRVGRRKGLGALRRWVRFTVLSAITFCVASAALILPLRLRVGIPTTNGFLIAIAYGAFLSCRLTYYLAMVAVAVGLLGVISAGVIAKIRSGERKHRISPE